MILPDWRAEIERRLISFLHKHGTWFPGETPTERQWTYRINGLLFYLISDIGKQAVWVQTEPLDRSAVYYSSSLVDEKLDLEMLNERVLPIVDRLMVLDDLAAICR